MTRKRLGRDIKCETCGKLFYVCPSRLEKNKHHTCSRKCAGKLSSKLHSKKIKTQCKNCGKEVFYKKSHFKNIKNHTCSQECNVIIQKKTRKGENNSRHLGLNKIEKFFWKRANNLKYRAEANGWDYNLDYLYLLDLYNKQNKRCYYSSLELKMFGKKSYNTLSALGS